MKLYDKHVSWTDSGLQLDRLKDLEARDMRPEVETVRIVESSSNDYAYLVAKVEVLDVPFDQADVVSDRVEIIACSCSDWYFNKSAGIETGEKRPSEVAPCKHATVYRTEKAKSDQHQETL